MRGSSFFEGVRQIDIEIGGELARLPIFYYDCSVMTALFPARHRELQRLMPDPRFVPARLAPGLGCVIVSALEYRDCDLHPYNELMIAVQLAAPGRTNFPGRPLVDSLAQPMQIHAFILHLPVTTPIALAGGVDFYNFPKFLAAIDFAEDDGTLSCRLAEGSEHILTLTGSPIATPHARQSTVFSHLYMDGQPQLAEVKMNETAKGVCRRPGSARLTLGDRHPVARELDRLLVSTRSVHYERTPRMEAILFGPEHLTIPLIERGLHAAAAAAAAATRS